MVSDDGLLDIESPPRASLQFGTTATVEYRAACELAQARAEAAVTMETLAAGATALGLPFDDTVAGVFERYRRYLLAENRRITLPSIVEPTAVETRHFLDALTCALPLLARWGVDAIPPLRCLDVGSGGG